MKRKKRMKSYKVKLKVTSKKQNEFLKLMSGSYRAIFNSSIDLQQKVLHYNATKGKPFLISGTKLYDHFRSKSSRLFPYLASLDRGILSAACFHASVSFKSWWEQYGPSYKYCQPKHLAKKNAMHFRTDGNVRVFYDYIEIPKLGKIKLFEKGRIPQGKKYSNITFSHDGNDWFISLAVLNDEKERKEKLTGPQVTVDFNEGGELLINNEVVESIVSSDKYQKELRKRTKLVKKLRRQKKANLVMTVRGREEIRTSKNMQKTISLIAKADVRMENMRKDQFKKVANRVAITKPKKLIGLSKEVIIKERQGGLSIPMREKHTLDFLNVLQKKLENIGTQVVLHKSLKRFLSITSGSGDSACGEVSGDTSMKQELCIA